MEKRVRTIPLGKPIYPIKQKKKPIETYQVKKSRKWIWVVVIILMILLAIGLFLYLRCKPKNNPETVVSLNEEIKNNLFYNSTSKKANILLQEGKTAQVMPGSGLYGVALGVRTKDGSNIKSFNHLQYKINLDDHSDGNCIDILGRDKVDQIFITEIDEWINIEAYNSDKGFALIKMNIPEDTEFCEQKIIIETIDNERQEEIEDMSFILDIKREWNCGFRKQ